MIIHIPKKAQTRYIELRRAAKKIELLCRNAGPLTQLHRKAIAHALEDSYIQAISDICGETVAGHIIMAADHALCPELNLPQAFTVNIYDAIGWSQ